MGLSRRQILKTALGTSTLFVGGSFVQRAIAQMCGITPPQTEGPFYPEVDQLDKDTDLTWVKNKNQQAKGEIIFIQGRVQDEGCKPISGALVEIWQACASGRYNHSGDPNPAPLDPNFQYWGRAITNSQGEYSFKTIRPGAYPADVGWVRPPHIHFKISKLGYHELTTQLYFDDEPLNREDKILQKIPTPQREAVITKVDPISKHGRFDITIQRV